MTDYQTLPASTRVWIYQSSRPFRETEIPKLKENVDRFAQSWISHNHQLKAHGDVLHNRFIVLMVDESQAGASGCSIDKSVYFMKQIEQAYGVDLFDRMTFAWMEGEEVKSANSADFAALFQQGKITGNTLVFDNLVKTKGELEENWLKPLNESWHKRFV
ncbi:MAG: hypothetical protein R2830_00370 [Saprospiraceae bacterium]